MPTTTDILTVRLDAPTPALELTLRHASPFWELTIQNFSAAPFVIDNREFVFAAGGALTIARRTRTPSFRFQISARGWAWYAPDSWAYTVQITPPKTPLDTPTVTVSNRVTGAPLTTLSFARPIYISSVLPLEATVSPTVVTLKNTSTDTTLYLGPDPLYPGDTMFIGREDVAALPYIQTPLAPTKFYDLTFSAMGMSVTLVPPAPPPVQTDPDFDAAAFFPHVLQQLYFRDRALLTDILLTQGFTPGQIATFLAAVAEF